MIRAVFDTNVLVNYLLTHRPPIARLIDRHLTQEDIVLVTAPELLEGLDRVLQCPKLQRYYKFKGVSKMDPITTSIVIILGKYALDKGVELGKEVGPKALETAKEMFRMVLERVKEVDLRTAQKFPENPEGYKAPLTDALDEALQADADLAAKLEVLLGEYEAAAKGHAAATGTTYQVTATGSGPVAVGEKATAGGVVAVGGEVHGGIHIGDEEKDE